MTNKWYEIFRALKKLRDNNDLVETYYLTRHVFKPPANMEHSKNKAIVRMQIRVSISGRESIFSGNG